MTRSTDFSLEALFHALDAQRLERGLTWAEVTREINRESERSPLHPVHASTVKATRTQRVAEADGILQMLLWLRRSPESFTPGFSPSRGLRGSGLRLNPNDRWHGDCRTGCYAGSHPRHHAGGTPRLR